VRIACILILVAGAQTLLAAAVPTNAPGGAQWPGLTPSKSPVLGQVKTGNPAAAPASPSITVSVRQEQGELEMRFKERRLLLYAFGPQQYKPYVRALCSLKGHDILRDAPPDHLHHHGLMYAIRVNGVNFWEETGQPGYERPVNLLPPQSGHTAAGLPQATFTQLIHWVANRDRSVADTTSAALLVERRTLVLTVDETAQEVALEWRGDFEAGPAAPKVTLAGASYHGLGLRLPKEFDHVARHQNSENLPYPTEGKGDVTSARWSCVSGTTEGEQISISLLGSPAAQRGPLKFFTMLDAFAYLAATQGLDKEPLEYSAGEKFSLRYLLTIHGSPPTPQSLNERQQLWEKTFRETFK
jgi:hypothetical protein